MISFFAQSYLKIRFLLCPNGHDPGGGGGGGGVQLGKMAQSAKRAKRANTTQKPPCVSSQV